MDSNPWDAHHAVAAATVAAAIAATLGDEFICLDGKPPAFPTGESAEASIVVQGQNVAAMLAAVWAAGFCSTVDTIRLEKVDERWRYDW